MPTSLLSRQRGNGCSERSRAAWLNSRQGKGEGLGACTRVCVQVCSEVEGKARQPEQKQAQAGVNGLPFDDFSDPFQF